MIRSTGALGGPVRGPEEGTAWPAEMVFSASARCAPEGSWSNRSVLVTAVRLFPRGWQPARGEFELIDQLLVGRCLLECVEVSPVDVLDKCLFEAVDVARGRLDKDRDGLKAGPARRPPAPLPAMSS